MRIPDPKPAPLSERGRVLREVRAIQVMLQHIRAKLPKMGADRPMMRGDQALCEALELVMEKGRELAADLNPARPLDARRSRGVTAFLDLAYAAKVDFFQRVEQANDWFRV